MKKGMRASLEKEIVCSFDGEHQQYTKASRVMDDDVSFKKLHAYLKQGRFVKKQEEVIAMAQTSPEAKPATPPEAKAGNDEVISVGRWIAELQAEEVLENPLGLTQVQLRDTIAKAQHLVASVGTAFQKKLNKFQVLRHRIGLTYEAEAENINTDDIITQILNVVEVP